MNIIQTITNWFINLPIWVQGAVYAVIAVWILEMFIMPWRLNITYTRISKLLKKADKFEKDFEALQQRLTKDEEMLAFVFQKIVADEIENEVKNNRTE